MLFVVLKHVLLKNVGLEVSCFVGSVVLVHGEPGCPWAHGDSSCRNTKFLGVANGLLSSNGGLSDKRKIQENIKPTATVPQSKAPKMPE